MPSRMAIDTFWAAKLVSAQTPPKPSSVLPANLSAKLKHQMTQSGQGIGVDESYRLAVEDCKAKVAVIIEECKRVQLKYSDPHFDLDHQDYCLYGLAGRPPHDKHSAPACAKRLTDIFDKPKFFVGGFPHVQDTRQGAEGDCWFLSALNSICFKDETQHLVEKLCPLEARNEDVGVYGFVFCRDGEWISEIIDDTLYLKNPDYDDCEYGDENREAIDHHLATELFAVNDAASRRKRYREIYQTGSTALFFSSCTDEHETWLPLLEKAFAKAHGDYSALNGGQPGEGVEDLTGGITTSMKPSDILHQDYLWEELLKANSGTEFLFGMGTKTWKHDDGGPQTSHDGIEDGHAYSVLSVANYQKDRLLLLKNPWGQMEWTGAWSDNSKEWKDYPNAYKDLNYSPGDNGMFWMPYEEFLRVSDTIQRTRLFPSNWKVSSKWTTMRIPWAIEDNSTKFRINIAERTRTVIVLSQLDSRYFVGLEGQYVTSFTFSLHFKGNDIHTVRGYSSGTRSATTELELDAGEWDVFVQLSTKNYILNRTIEDVVTRNWVFNKEKLMQIGLSYDLAQAKGRIEPENEPMADPGQNKIMAPTPTASSSLVQGKKVPNSSSSVDSNIQINSSRPTDPYNSLDDWDASIVLGLRVFCESSTAQISVVDSRNETATDPGKATHVLDVDDPEKDPAGQHVSSSVVSKAKRVRIS